MSAVAELIDSGRVPVHYLSGRRASALRLRRLNISLARWWFGALDHIGDLLPLHQQDTLSAPARNTWRVSLATRSAPVDVTVRRVTSAHPAQLTCHSSGEKFYPAFELVRIDGTPVLG